MERISMRDSDSASDIWYDAEELLSDDDVGAWAPNAGDQETQPYGNQPTPSTRHAAAAGAQAAVGPSSQQGTFEASCDTSLPKAVCSTSAERAAAQTPQPQTTTTEAPADASVDHPTTPCCSDHKVEGEGLALPSRTATLSAEIAIPPADAVEEAEPQEPFPVHRAAYNGHPVLLRRLVAGMSPEQLKQHDSQGNTALHCAAMRRQPVCAAVLLAAGAPAGHRNGRGWSPLMEAVEQGDRRLALQLARAEVAQMRAAVKAKKSALLALLRCGMPDFTLQLKWELASGMPGVSGLLRRYAPHDTYSLWKKGGRIRVDGSLMGIDDHSPSLVPEWKRGHFSLLYDASGDKARALFVNHTDKKYIDVKAAKKKLGVDETVALEAEVDALLTSEVLQVKKVRSVDFKFKPVTGWLTKEVKEKVEGWKCKLYEASGRMVSVSRYKMPLGLPADLPFDAYLTAQLEVDPLVESPVNPLNPMTLKDKGTNPEKAAAKAAVAAKHARIAAAATARKDVEAAQLAKAAAARAAAGARRALSPSLEFDTEGLDDGDEDRELAEELGISAGRSSNNSRKAREGSAAAAADGRGPGREGKVAEEGEVDLQVWAQQVAAEAQAAREARMAAGEGGEVSDDDAGTGAPSGCPGSSMADTRQTLASSPCGSTCTQRTELSHLGHGAAAAAGGGGPSPGTATSGFGVKTNPNPHLPGSGIGAAKAESQAAEKAALAGGGSKRSFAFGDVKGSKTAAGAAEGSAGAHKSKGMGSLFGFRKKAGSASGPSATAGSASGEAGAGGSTAAGAGGSMAGAGAGAGAGMSAAARKSRKMTGKCWMAEDFPLSLHQLLPLLEVVGTANKVLGKVARFMRKYGDMAMFPVKVQVPLLFTIYALLSFKQFKLLGDGPDCTPMPDDAFFELPPDYTEGTMEDFDAPSSRSHHRMVRVGADSRRSSGTNVPKPHAAAGTGGRDKAAAADGDGDGGSGEEQKEKEEEREGQGDHAAGGEAQERKAEGDDVGSGRAEAPGQDPGEALAEALVEAHIEAGRKGRGRHREHKRLGLGEEDRPRLRLLQGGDEDEDEMGLCGGLGLGEDD